MNLQVARPLLDVEKSRGVRPPARFFPVALALLLLFANAYTERYLTDDPDGFYIHLFLFLHAALCAAIATEHFANVTAEILAKTAVFPVDPWTRFVFVMGSLLRQPALRVLWAVDAFSLAIIFRHTTASLIVAPVAFTVLYLCLLTLASLVFLVVTRLQHRVAVVAFAGAWGAVAILLVSTLFHVPSLLQNLPLLHSIAQAIMSAGAGSTGSSIVHFILPLLVTGGAVLAGRRYA
jgi:hypothetical protein